MCFRFRIRIRSPFRSKLGNGSRKNAHNRDLEGAFEMRYALRAAPWAVQVYLI